jgi:hypothetical protein
VGTHAGIKFFDFFGQRFLIQDHTAERGERPDPDEAHLHRPGTAKYGRGHERTVFGVGGRELATATATHV